jgi:hypothetical protein
MNTLTDRKMFAPLRRRETVSPETKIFGVLQGYEAGTGAADLADRLVHSGIATGTRSLVVKRIAEMLHEMEQAGKVERIPDGRYRVVRGVKAL